MKHLRPEDSAIFQEAALAVPGVAYSKSPPRHVLMGTRSQVGAELPTATDAPQSGAVLGRDGTPCASPSFGDQHADRGRWSTAHVSVIGWRPTLVTRLPDEPT